MGTKWGKNGEKMGKNSSQIFRNSFRFFLVSGGGSTLLRRISAHFCPTNFAHAEGSIVKKFISTSHTQKGVSSRNSYQFHARQKLFAEASHQRGKKFRPFSFKGKNPSPSKQSKQSTPTQGLLGFSPNFPPICHPIFPQFANTFPTAAALFFRAPPIFLRFILYNFFISCQPAAVFFFTAGRIFFRAPPIFLGLIF